MTLYQEVEKANKTTSEYMELCQRIKLRLSKALEDCEVHTTSIKQLEFTRDELRQSHLRYMVTVYDLQSRMRVIDEEVQKEGSDKLKVAVKFILSQ